MPWPKRKDGASLAPTNILPERAACPHHLAHHTPEPSAACRLAQALGTAPGACRQRPRNATTPGSLKSWNCNFCDRERSGTMTQPLLAAHVSVFQGSTHTTPVET